MIVSNSTDKELRYDALRELYRRDFPLFAAEQITLTSKKPGEFIHLYPFTGPQAVLHREAEAQRKEEGWVRVVAIKGRQFGFSSYSVGLAYHLASLNSAVDTLHLACDDDTVSSIFTKAKLMYDRTEEELRPLSRFDNKKMLRFENPDARTRPKYPGLASQMRISHAKNILAGTGTTGHYLHLSEASKYNSEVCAVLESSIFPSLHLQPGTVCINESTAYYKGDYFRSCCERAMSGKTEWKFVFVPWYCERTYVKPIREGERFRLTKIEREIQKVAERGLTYGSYNYPPQTILPEQFNWRRNMIASREDGENFFFQEFPGTFEEAWITYDVNVFNRDRMYEMRQALCQPKRFGIITPDGRVLDDQTQSMGQEEEYFAIWEEPEPGERYDIGIDTSAGMAGGDFSVAEVIKRNTREQVAEFRVRMDAMELGEKIFWLGKFYNTAQIALEMASTGFACNAQLQRLGYPYLYIWRHRERAFPTLSTYSGWKTNFESKGYMVSLFTSAVNKSAITIHSRVLWHEMFNYVKEPSLAEFRDRYMAAAGGYDDCVMAFGIALVTSDDETFGQHSPISGDQKSRKQMIAEAMARGGAAFSDDREGASSKGGFMQSQKNFMRGFD